MRFQPGLQHEPQEVAVVDEEGHVGRGINWQLTPEEYQQVTDGYRCLHCMEPFTAAFPEKCPVCGFHVKTQQTFELARQHQGTKEIGDSPAWKALDEERERENWKKRTGIWLP